MEGRFREYRKNQRKSQEVMKKMKGKARELRNKGRKSQELKK